MIFRGTTLFKIEKMIKHWKKCYVDECVLCDIIIDATQKFIDGLEYEE